MPAPRPSLTVDDVRRFVDDHCFVVSASPRVGIEAEWLPVFTDEPDRIVPPDLVGSSGSELPAGSRLTFEPGGQVELSSPPLRGIGPACAALAADAAALSQRLEEAGAGLVALGLHPGEQERNRCVQSPRYEAMETYFDAQCAAGRTMMRATAALQVNIDAGSNPTDIATRWQRAHDIGPTLAAAFANSPLAGGIPSGWRSRRLAIWSDVDACRTDVAETQGNDPQRDWTAYALDARVMLIRATNEWFVPLLAPLTFASWIESGHELGYPTIDDLEYHLTTLFPPVRPRGWLEMRMIDALPDPWWRAAVAVATTLVCDDVAAANAAAAVEPTRERWLEAARHGLAHPELAAAASACFGAAIEAMVRLGTDATTVSAVESFVDRYVERGRCPADDRLADWAEDGATFPEPDRFVEATWA